MDAVIGNLDERWELIACKATASHDNNRSAAATSQLSKAPSQQLWRARAKGGVTTASTLYLPPSIPFQLPASHPIP